MSKRPSAELVRQLLDYDPETGSLRWRPRPREMFSSDRSFNTWNARFAGAEAMTAVIGIGYRVGDILRVKHRAHRVIWLWMTGEWPDQEIDHINGDPSDNRWANLRSVSRRENCKNQRRSSKNTSGVTGVSWRRDNSKWLATIKVDRKVINLGSFTRFQDAVRARAAAEARYNFHPNHGRR